MSGFLVKLSRFLFTRVADRPPHGCIFTRNVRRRERFIISETRRYTEKAAALGSYQEETPEDFAFLRPKPFRSGVEMIDIFVTEVIVTFDPSRLCPPILVRVRV